MQARSSDCDIAYGSSSYCTWYGTCWIGAFNEEEVKRILEIPENLVVVALLPVGVPDENPKTRPRKAFSQIFFEESYGIPLEL